MLIRIDDESLIGSVGELNTGNEKLSGQVIFTRCRKNLARNFSIGGSGLVVSFTIVSYSNELSNVFRLSFGRVMKTPRVEKPAFLFISLRVVKDAFSLQSQTFDLPRIRVITAHTYIIFIVIVVVIV